VLAIVSVTTLAGPAGANDLLYISNTGDNTVIALNASTGALVGTVAPQAPPGVDCAVEPRPVGCIAGPRGLISVPKQGAPGRELIVVNQNVALDPLKGEILRYDLPSNVYQGAVVPLDDPAAPGGPRGIVLSPDGQKLFVADISDPPVNGVVKVFDRNGNLIADLPVPPLAPGKEFHPRGLVFGPDGLLYVASAPVLPPPGDIGGQVYRYDPNTLSFVDVFIDSEGGFNSLNRPEGLVFSRSGKLFITSFIDRTNPNDVDRILIYNGPLRSEPGKRVGRIDLWTTGQPRVFAQALLFGPGGKLYVPLSSGAEVRRYDVTSFRNGVAKAMDIFSLNVNRPWYLTFGKTNPSTLGYGS
jgi:DNA-binding beta-propeller fold protein YncE